MKQFIAIAIIGVGILCAGCTPEEALLSMSDLSNVSVGGSVAHDKENSSFSSTTQYSSDTFHHGHGVTTTEKHSSKSYHRDAFHI